MLTTTEEQQRPDTSVPAMLVGIGALLVCLAVGALLTPYRGSIGLENLTIVYVTVVAIAAVAGGGGGGFLAAAAAALSYTFFFTTPYLSLRVDTLEQAITVALLFAAGIVVSLAANLARGQLADGWPTADVLEDEAAELVTAVVRAKASGGDADHVAVEGLRHLFDARWVALVPSDDASGRAYAAGGEPPTAATVNQPRSGVWNSALRWPPRPAAGAVAQVHVEQERADALIVVPRAQRPLSSEKLNIVLAVVLALEDDSDENVHP